MSAGAATRLPTRACLLAIAAAACRAHPLPCPRPLTVAEIAGEYELVRIGDDPLPAQPRPGRLTVFSGHLQLTADLRFTSTGRREVCAPGGLCRTRVDTTHGTWLILRDGRLYFDNEQGYSWPPPPIEANGHQIRIYPIGSRLQAMVFDRR